MDSSVSFVSKSPAPEAEIYEVVLTNRLRLVIRRAVSPKATTKVRQDSRKSRKRKRPLSVLQPPPSPNQKAKRSRLDGTHCAGTSRTRKSLFSTVLPSSTPWVPSLGLTNRERYNLEVGEWLEDKHIAAAQTLLKRQFPNVDGLQPPSLGQVLQFQPVSPEKIGLQIMHNGSGHWVTVSSVDGKVTMFDNLGVGLSPLLQAQITCLSAGASTVSWPHTQRQRGASDCGLFAIANCMELALGRDPTDVMYDQAQMRTHLARCFEEEELKSFPQREGIRPPAKKKAVRLLDL